MKFIHRLGYYLGGFGIGLILLFFFLGGKKTSCDYGLDARVLKNLRIKEKTYSDQAILEMKKYQIDTADIATVLTNGDVDFSKSNTKLKHCKTYHIEGVIQERTVALSIENCDSIANVNAIEIIK